MINSTYINQNNGSIFKIEKKLIIQLIIKKKIKWFKLNSKKEVTINKIIN